MKHVFLVMVGLVGVEPTNKEIIVNFMATIILQPTLRHSSRHKPIKGAVLRGNRKPLETKGCMPSACPSSAL